MRGARCRPPSLLLLGLWLAAGAAGAAVPPGHTCQASQLRAAARLFSGEFGCEAAYYKNPAADPGGAVRLPACRADVEAAFGTAYDDSVTSAGPGTCALETPAVDVIGSLAADVDGLVVGISGAFQGTDPAEETLHAALEKATGQALSSALGAESQAAKKDDEAKRLAARSKARAKLLDAFAKALARAEGVSYTGLSASAVADQVDAIVDGLAALTAPRSYSISGTIHAADGSYVDSDVNDPDTVPVSNDTPATAQSIPVPSAVGGYVNLAGRGPKGNSHDNGDPQDYYRVSLAAGQRVTLRFGDPLHADLDLCLYDVANPLLPVDCSLGTTDTEELLVPSTGDFYVEVMAWSGCACGSTYVLTLGQSLASAGANGVRLSDEFAPGEAIVTLAPKVGALAAGPPAAASAYAAGFGMRALGGASDREMLFQLPAAAAERTATFQTLAQEPAREALHARLAGLSPERSDKLDTLIALKALRARADVAAADPNFIRRAQATPNDTYYGLQWDFPLINLPAAWDVTTGSANVAVAVIDTGVLYGHPDLQGQLAPGFDFVSDPSRALDGDGIDANAEDPGDGGGLSPSSFHGTHVAGTIGARTNNGQGVAGVAWNVTIVPVRALGFGGAGTSYDILQAVRYASGLANDSGSTHLVDVINLSLGGGSFSSAEQSVYSQARAAGVIVVAAAGNNDSSQLFYPASYDGVVSVSAVDLRGQKAPYSNFGPTVDVAAPGGDMSADRNGDGYGDGVLSTLENESTGAFTYAFYQGTSMATPHVAGVAALMKAVNPALSPALFDTLLASGALTTDLGTPGRDDIFGYGLIDALKAVEAASGSASNTPFLLVSPGALNLGTLQTQASLQVSNGGGGSLTVTSVTDDQPWLSVTPSAVNGSGLGAYQVAVDRTGLADGTYTGTITVASSAGSVSISLVMSVLSGNLTPNAGFHYVLLVDPTSLDTVAEFDVAPSNGQYAYSLSNVPSGSYLLFAGSDADNDFFICGTGEACGAWPTLGSPEPLVITSDLTGLDFLSGFLQSLAANAAGGGKLPPGGLRRVVGRQLAR